MKKNGAVNRVSVILKASLIIIVLVLATAWYFRHMKYYPSTEDAYVGTNLVNITPKISGYVTNVQANNHQFVQKGQVLFRIETTDYSVSLEQKRQAVIYADEQTKNAQAQIKNLKAGLYSAKANYEFLNQQLLRYQQMNKQSAASLEQVQQYNSQLKQARAQVDQYNNQLDQAEIQIKAAEAQVAQAKTEVVNAQNHVGYAEITSPVDGYISNMNLIQGQFVSSGVPVFGIVDSTNWWVDANFKETDLERIRVGQKVKIKLDMYPDAKYFGTVQSISHASGNTFSLLPAQNATGNWVKVTQRFTVRIKVENNPMYPLRVGASTHVEVDTTNGI